jgi:hypothetical protein
MYFPPVWLPHNSDQHCLTKNLLVDSHTANHIFTRCLKGSIMASRTIILVSHHVQLCLPGASNVIALENGRVQYCGASESFKISGMPQELERAEKEPVSETQKDNKAATKHVKEISGASMEKKSPRKLVEAETRAVGQVRWGVWRMYFAACGRYVYWSTFVLGFVLAALSQVAETAWIT